MTTKRKFKRSIFSISLIIYWILFVFFPLILLLLDDLPFYIFSCSYILAWIIFWVITPADFKYSIEVYDDWIIFEFSEEERQRLDRNNLSIYKSKRKYLILDDGLAKMKILYSNDVLQFLKDFTKQLPKKNPFVDSTPKVEFQKGSFFYFLIFKYLHHLY